MKAKKLLKMMNIIIFIIAAISCNKERIYNEQHRLQYHFSPPLNWMNDPNGMTFYNGEYHLFYQHYPDSNVWGPMHWGHAVSRDLVHWENLPIALYPDSLGYIFSGSAVVDLKNRSGLQKGIHPPILAIFTQHSESRAKEGKNDFQNQSIAFSNDNGRSFIKYAGNPVLKNPGEKDFRDPKVIWIDSLGKWVMVLAAGQKIKFYSSSDFIRWDYLSDFGERAGSHEGVWECPDLFRMKTGEIEKWVLLVNINRGGPNGGSGTQYFTGHFDGKSFFNDNSDDTILWLDYGPDDYAGVTWSDIPESDGRRIFIGWMSNWDYAQKVPTTPWRNAMTIPRSLELRNTKRGARLCSAPADELKLLRSADSGPDFNKNTLFRISGLNEIIAEFDLGKCSSEEFGFTFSNSLDEKLKVGFDVRNNKFYVDRTNSGKTGFADTFAAKHFAPRFSVDGKLKIHLYLDYSSLELFADDGSVTMTEIFFPNENFNRMLFFEKNGSVKKLNVTTYDLKSIWKK